ncbi:unnamed protein product [Victoria cruziana]
MLLGRATYQGNFGPQKSCTSSSPRGRPKFPFQRFEKKGYERRVPSPSSSSSLLLAANFSSIIAFSSTISTIQEQQGSRLQAVAYVVCRKLERGAGIIEGVSSAPVSSDILCGLRTVIKA